MIIADTSIWIDLLGRGRKFKISSEQLAEIAVCPPILQEILQGIRMDAAWNPLRESLLAFHCLERAIDLKLYLEAADIYRRGRKKGKTIRSSVDCLIAAIAMKHDIPVWHDDRDFEEIATFTHLRTIRGPSIR